ncbi:hypothetical protein DENSPDRAFT_767864 [Dentipellis sp. KUC8613]|nr:hypothetical protein DENSPDRAFT_767864 [Dentipellis sp. KUC8613]
MTTIADDLTHTPRRRALAQTACTTKGAILFDPTITCKTDLAECFRVFTDPSHILVPPADRLTRRTDHPVRPHLHTIVYTDGSCINNGKANARCGSGVWFREGDRRNRSFRVPGSHQTNQVGELVAIILALQLVPVFFPLTIRTDSQFAVAGLTQHLPRWEDRGWIGVSNSELFKKAAFLLRRCTAPSELQWVEGHAGEEGNEYADDSADEGARKPVPDDLDLSIPDSFNLPGAKLAALTQSLAYQGIRSRKAPPMKLTTIALLEEAQHALAAFTGKLETFAMLWQGCRRRDMNRKVNQLLFCLFHNSFTLGSQWRHVPGKESRQQCTRCGAPDESIRHILIDCPSPSTQLIWHLARRLWPHSPHSWPTISLGLVLACGNLSVTDNQLSPTGAAAPLRPTAKARGAGRLLCTIISESTHTIWALRCEFVIAGVRHSPDQITTCWNSSIENCLSDDRIISCQLRRSPFAINRLRNTWEATLNHPPPNWHQNHEVLVGMTLPRDPTNLGNRRSTRNPTLPDTVGCG